MATLWSAQTTTPNERRENINPNISIVDVAPKFLGTISNHSLKVLPLPAL
jgi:hypothetical protein